MNHKTYLNLVALIFLAVAIMHAMRLVYKWDVQLGDVSVQIWASWLGLFVGGYLSYWGFKLGK